MTLTILLVDDEPQIRNTGKQTLELAGHKVINCDCGEQALKLITRDCGALITDVRMPGMDGFALMERALEIDPNLPVIMITGHGDIAMALRAVRCGAYDFMEKPFPAEILVDTVRRALERRTLIMENRRLKDELAASSDNVVIGRAPSMERVRTIIASVAETDADVLIMGETGTGKELVARALHHQSERRSHNFVALNCGALPESLFESELFGYEVGTFTGAAKSRIGRIQFAHKGTLFLDEIESMPLSLQVKILRILQERTVEPLGSNETVPVDIRVVSATKTNLKQASAEGRFREDLYYRLNVVTIQIPPLRERREDIPLLFQHFVLKAAARYHRDPPKLTPQILYQLNSHSWPGNVRELKNTADRFVLGVLNEEEIAATSSAVGAPLNLPEQIDIFEKSVIKNVLTLYQGDVRSTVEALGIPRKTFYDKVRRFGIVVDDFR
ncbi:MAG TPA: sigma-54 dependent transcriptional regulator [Telmatospirillum sp.]|nr:sigma-54 dependent transcriptional regulator [Telmatospirillum sp.]